ncbi:MAG: DUF559 domain-containing protein [Elusimicrobia bacterium]|nr:DUF559 domain-containing protein [Elusimicrobiota bacterium]
MGSKLKNVLIGVVKTRRDLEMILRERAYRMPVEAAPKRAPRYIAFYQPSSVKEKGGLIKVHPAGFDGTIRYWAPIKEKTKLPRVAIVPDEPDHPKAQESYWLIKLGPIRKLPRPIANKRRMRVVFGFTTLQKLKNSREVKDLFDVPPLEEITEELLKDMRLPYRRQFIVRLSAKKRYRLDFALIRKRIAVAVECDGKKSHGRPEQKIKDAQKDADLRNMGWSVVRLKEKQILTDLKSCRKKLLGVMVRV